MPASSFVIFRLVPLSQLPLSVTSEALGASRRNVTVRSGWMSGERSGAGRAAAGAAAGACCATTAVPTARTINAVADDRRTHVDVFMDASLPRYSKSPRDR